MATDDTRSLPIGSTFYQWDRGVDVRCTIIGEVEPWTDTFGRAMYKRMARREDTGREGYIHFGPGGVLRTEPDHASDPDNNDLMGRD